MRHTVILPIVLVLGIILTLLTGTSTVTRARTDDSVASTTAEIHFVPGQGNGQPNGQPGQQPGGERPGQSQQKQVGPWGNLWPMLGARDIISSVENLEKGIRVTLTSDQNGGAERLQKFGAFLVQNASLREKGVAVTAENTEEGVTLTLISEKEEVVKEMQALAEKEAILKRLRESGVKIHELIQREVTLTEKGVQVSIFSDNADVARLIQIDELYKPAKPEMQGDQGGQGGQPRGPGAWNNTPNGPGNFGSAEGGKNPNGYNGGQPNPQGVPFQDGTFNPPGNAGGVNNP